MNCAIFRFSHCAVALGKVPPAGIALTGSWSPCPPAISPSTSRTNFGAWGEMGGIRSNLDETAAGSFTFSRCASAVIHRCIILFDHRLAALAIGLVDGLLDLRDRLLARQHAADGEEAGLHDGVDARCPCPPCAPPCSRRSHKTRSSCAASLPASSLAACPIPQPPSKASSAGIPRPASPPPAHPSSPGS